MCYVLLVLMDADTGMALFEAIQAASERAGVDFDMMRAVDLLPPRTPDNEVLELAANEGRVTVTHDVNTMPAVADYRVANRLAMAGLILSHQQTPPYYAAQWIVHQHVQREEWDLGWEGAIEWVPTLRIHSRL